MAHLRCSHTESEAYWVPQNYIQPEYGHYTSLLPYISGLNHIQSSYPFYSPYLYQFQPHLPDSSPIREFYWTLPVVQNSYHTQKRNIPERAGRMTRAIQQSSSAAGKCFNHSRIPKGPPRKPRQSGNALWIGNLASNVTVTGLKDHFSNGFTNDIDSIYLLAKTHCAFVNYRSEEACIKAQLNFHESWLNGVRIVCRLRRPSVNDNNSSTEDEGISMAEESTPPKTSERYFIMKSLTLHDLELSVRYGIWTTQPSNEALLLDAYRSAEKVYLIFSANKSGEYYGYAQMISSMTDAPSPILNQLPQSVTSRPEDEPLITRTEATEYAPRGYIFEDISRGILFWESERNSSNDKSEEYTTQRFNGKPFRIAWLSTNRVAFNRTRGLRNPLNGNKEVKVARDGTELEASVGKYVVQLFH